MRTPAAPFGVHRRCRITRSSQRQFYRPMPALVAALTVTALAPTAASAQSVGVNVGAGQSVSSSTNLTGANAVTFGVEFEGAGGTFTNTGSIEATSTDYRRGVIRDSTLG